MMQLLSLFHTGARVARLIAAIGVTFVFLLATEFACAKPTDAQLEFFETRIRPVLVEHCYECHNSIDNAEGELALDFRQGTLDGGTSGAMLVPGKPGESQMLPILRHEIPELEMPQDGAKLSEEVVRDFYKWIAMGAPDPRDEPPSSEELEAATSWEAMLERRKQWWSFQPIVESEIPAVDGEGSSAHPVDRFVMQKVAEEGLQAGEIADSFALVRRVYFSLIGLPPDSEKLASWGERLDKAEGAERQAVFAELVDELLSSSQFGERWARHWMDWIRYAESHGSEGDPKIDNAWMYRDYLIRALNTDVSYKQLVREHVAGDLLEEPRVNEMLGINESMIGPAHWRMVFHGFAPTDALEERVRFTDDQINVFSKAFLGLTVSCARCHDHKFDAISQKDYYALFGILGSCRPSRVAIDLPERGLQLQEKLVELKPGIREAIAGDWLDSMVSISKRLAATKESSAVLKPLVQMKAAVEKGTGFEAAWQGLVQKWQQAEESDGKYALSWDLANQQDYASWFAEGDGLEETPQVAGEFAVASQGEKALTGIYPSGVYTHGLSEKSAASLNSDYFLAEEGSELWLRVIGDGNSSVRYVVQDYPRSGTTYPVPKLSNQWKWQKFDISYWQGDRVHIELVTAQDAPLLVAKNSRSWFGIREAIVRRKGESAQVEIEEHLQPVFEAAGERSPKTLEELAGIYQSAIGAAIEAWRVGEMTDGQALLLDGCLREGLLPNRLAALATAKTLLEEYRRVEGELAVPRRVHGLAETKGRDQHLFDRGNHKNPMELVPRRFLEAIDATPYQASLSGRLQLAEDLVREDNPLTRRVVVNRVWHHLLGQGIVGTPDNFGRLGALPTHPELLDWLAVRFQTEGWSLKKLIRLIVTSETWQRSSQPSADASEVDPDNRLLTHAHVRRLEAEAVRDSLLLASGLLDERQFGDSVGGKVPRRGIYVEVIRNSLDPFMRVFDFPEPFTATGRRDVTNVPAQSLTLMNDAGVIEYATSWAKRILGDTQLGNDEQRVGRMFETAFGRSATGSEIAAVQDYLATTTNRYQGIRRRRNELVQQQAEIEGQVQALLLPVRSRLEGADKNATTLSAPQPIGLWEMDGNLEDTVGQLHGQPKGGAKVDGDGLILKGNAYAITVPLKQDIREKTLEAWVQLDNTKQRGGGGMTLQTVDGVYFDSIVYGERDAKQWLAGSNGFSRTQPFKGEKDYEADERVVHVAIAYHADGRIVGYRDGVPYGKAYQSSGPYVFKQGKAVVTFGLRHLPAGGNRGLAGKIYRARLYDRALTAEEVAISFKVAANYVTEAKVVAELSDEERGRLEGLRSEIVEIQAKVTGFGGLSGLPAEMAAWTDLARAMFMMKEFIYVR